MQIKGIHHSAFRCRDAEETRAFYEDLLGLELACVVQGEREPGSGKPQPFVHLFFRMPDGNFFAFFDAPSSAADDKFAPVHGFDRHVAFEVGSLDELKAWQAKFAAAGVPCFGEIDHDFVRSIYFYDPNGIPLEITARTERHDEIIAREGTTARETLAAWTERKAHPARPNVA